MHLVRLVLLLDLLAAVLLAGAVLVVAGTPLSAAGRLGPWNLAMLVGLAGAIAMAAGGILLIRSVAHPVERLLRAAERLGGARGGLPVLPRPGEGRVVTLGSAVVAFERVSAALEEERGRLAAKIGELERTNQALSEARESWVRSERLAAVGRLGAGLAHEVGNPLGAITGYVAVARSRLPAGADPELQGSLERIGTAAARIDATIRDLLAFARPSPPALAGVEVAPVVEAVLRLGRVQPRFRGVEVRLDLPRELPPVRADAHRLSQVLLNLVLNGADALGEGGGLELAARVDPRDPEGVEITVADDGPGIPRENLERIFEPFFTTKQPGQGSGLGLAVSRALVESFGGRISAANRAGRGAVFTVSLRAARGGVTP